MFQVKVNDNFIKYFNDDFNEPNVNDSDYVNTIRGAIIFFVCKQYIIDQSRVQISIKNMKNQC